MKFSLIYFIELSVFCLKITEIPSTGVPPLSRGFGNLIFDPPQNQLVCFGGYLSDGTYLNDLYSFDLSKTKWKSITPSLSTKPDPRTGASMFYDSDNKRVLLYGGRTTSGPANDFWSYDPAQNKWQELSIDGDNPGARGYLAFTDFIWNSLPYYAVFGGLNTTTVDNSLYLLNGTTMTWKKMPNHGADPPISESADITYYQEKIYLWGGINRLSGNSQNTNLYIYDMNSESWSEINIVGDKPEGRFRHEIDIYDKYLYIFPGYGAEKGWPVLNVWRINLVSLSSWEKLHTVNSSIANGCGAAVLANSIFYSFGGVSSDDVLTNSLVSIDLQYFPLEWKQLSPHMISPSGRMYHSFHLLHDSLWVFGGINEDQALLNDLWKFDTTTETWSKINSNGDIPSARYMHASCSVQDLVLLFGGIDVSGFLNDFYSYSDFSNSWQVVTLSNSDRPMARAGACITFGGFYAILFGGQSFSGVLNDLWAFDINLNIFIQIDDGSSGAAPSLFQCKCFTRIIDSTLYLYVVSGEDAGGTPNSAIYRFNFSLKKWETLVQNQYSWFSVARSGVASVDKYLFLIGGEQWFLPAFGYIIMMNIDENSEYTLIGNLESPTYAPSILYFGNSIYLFGGGDSINGLAQTIKVKNSLLKINTETSDNFTWPCGIGTYSDGNSCSLCSGGYYSSYNLTTCLPCPAGTFTSFQASQYISQCYPCYFDTYAPDAGSTVCSKCPSSYYCPIGSQNPIVKLGLISYSSSQPNLYSSDADKADRDTAYMEIFFWTIEGMVVIIIIFYKPLHKYIHNFDSYDTMHDTPDNEPIYKKKTLIGGFFSIISTGVAALLIGISCTNYVNDNITETKTLAPLVTLLNSYSSYPGDVNITVSFLYYGGICAYEGSVCHGDLAYKFTNIKGHIHAPSCEFIEKNCIVTFLCSNCILETGAKLYAAFYEMTSYSSYIAIQVTSSSSIPGEDSSIYSLLKANNEKLAFRGATPSEFTFLMTPSLFKSEISAWPREETGYHVSLPSSPVSGSAYTVEELHFHAALQVNVNLDTGNTVLVTSRFYNQTLYIFLSSLIGAFFGIIQMGGTFMVFFEKIYLKYENKYKSVINWENLYKKAGKLSSSFRLNNKQINTKTMEGTSNSLSDLSSFRDETVCKKSISFRKL
ncbi:unnamed protein product [Blepharisma stoltei]|uniref:Tyrosine-protein kinase ephrin type A/B receptor-like domain-containing protein n=1 Tax=Blepharisma stoltei TaxID=1481888 RepID=A0AAU9K6B0_9CILI|nr:unnamed protein product [Blepharisma stoltei]